MSDVALSPDLEILNSQCRGFIASLVHADVAHDITHIERVVRVAIQLCNAEQANMSVVLPAACMKVGGSISRLLYNPNDPFCVEREADDKTYTLDHFFIKLLHIADSMNTPSAKAEANRRTRYMHEFLEQLKSEIGE